MNDIDRFTRRDFILSGAAGLATTLIPALARAQAGGTFRVGALNPVTGAGSPYGTGMQKMILAAAAEVNALGGAGGRKLEVFTEDTQTQPEAAVLATKKLVEVNRVQAVLGTWSSGVTLAVMPLTLKADVIQMNCSGAPDISTQDDKDLVWRYQATNDRFGMAFAEICKKRGFKRPATMAFNNASGLGNTNGFKKAWEAAGGQVVAHVTYEPKRSTYKTELQQIMNAKPDVIVTGSYLPDTTIILREWFQAGGDNKWVIPGWAANEQLIQALGKEVCEGLISVDSVSNEKAPSFARYDAEYKKAMNQPGTNNVYAAMTWDMLIVLALAMEAAGPNATVQQINARIRNVANGPGEVVYGFEQGAKLLKAGKKINFEGASSRLEFDKFGDVSPDFGVYIVEQGKLVRRDVVSI